jgi:hypothetical protein
LFFHLLDKEYIFSNYTQYLLDYPSNSHDEDSDWLFEKEVVHVTEPDPDVMDPDLVMEELDSQSSITSKDCGRYCHQLMTCFLSGLHA